MPRVKIGSLGLQCHITHACNQRCAHCYLFDSPTYDLDPQSWLDASEWVRIIDDLAVTARRWGTAVALAFTGGDPLLHPDFFTLLRHAQKRRVQARVYGNPYHVDRTTARDLAACGVQGYQISLDGLEKKHDGLRRAGSFAASIRALRALRRAGVPTAVMFTLSRANRNDLLDVIHLAAELEVGVFSFDLLTPTGRGEDMRDQMLQPTELREILAQVTALWEQLTRSGAKTAWDHKISLWKLWWYERGELDHEYLRQAASRGECLGGCAAGDGFLVVQPNGLVFPCARLPVPIGQMPRDTISHILTTCSFLKRLRQPSNYQKCKTCPLAVTCRGCPAHAYNLLGDPFAPDPYCWRERAETQAAVVHYSTAVPSDVVAPTDRPSGLDARSNRDQLPKSPRLPVERFGFTDLERTALAATGFHWRKKIELDSQPHLCHTMFVDAACSPPAGAHTAHVFQPPLHVSCVEGRYLAFDPVTMCIAQVPGPDVDVAALRAAIRDVTAHRLVETLPQATLRVPAGRPLRALSAAADAPFYVVVTANGSGPDLRDTLSALLHAPDGKRTQRIGVQLAARDLTMETLDTLKHFDVELRLDFQWPQDFGHVSKRLDFSLPAAKRDLLNALIAEYMGRLTAHVVGSAEDWAALAEALLACGFRSFDLVGLFDAGGKSDAILAQVDRLVAIVMARLRRRAVTDWVPLTHALRQLYTRWRSHNCDTSAPDAACLECWAHPLCGGEHSGDQGDNCRVRRHFFARAVQSYVTASEHDPEGLRLLCQTPRGLPRADAETREALANRILFLAG